MNAKKDNRSPLEREADAFYGKREAEHEQCPRCGSHETHETGHVTHEGAIEHYCDGCDQHFKVFGDDEADADFDLDALEGQGRR